LLRYLIDLLGESFAWDESETVLSAINWRSR